jgi:hypothetical protein
VGLLDCSQRDVEFSKPPSLASFCLSGRFRKCHMLRQIRTCAVERSTTLPFAVIGYRLGRHCEAQRRSRKTAVGRSRLSWRSKLYSEDLRAQTRPQRIVFPETTGQAEAS